ncbi:ATP-binding cassette domain-containing protein [Tepidibacter formicigenes]|jgi:tungstate transport system ATP-binding protein|uniref:Tungstate transport system ATP-binding protein n=1 Tax=Tepidibacter formicigenes DSM 15518 TaxID=1123349 RepID=A0A1M6QGB2_9FIRM|nr:ATP-binding cassette domain-containing protein [Tepidibacter formicigenes]SHK19205.1 tungstate transport system ATP-binding protein [Tepidibacter formicigenes DSM 15518]
MDIQINNLKKYYKDKLVLDIDNLQIKKRIITGIIGPNGAGKSTLLNIIAGMDKDFKGSVLYKGKSIDKNIYKDMTLVLQRPNLFKRSVYENIEYPLKIRSISKGERKVKVENILKRLDILDLKDKKGHLLSGGESQKVSLGRALVFTPKLLLLDEPTSNIDTNSTNLIEREILNYNKINKSTVIIITHDLKQAKRLCDEIVCIERGKVGGIDGVF